MSDRVNVDTEVSVIVSAVADKTNGRTNVNVMLPREQRRLSVRDISHILASGISLLIKSCNNNGTEIKDYELMAEVIAHLNAEFGSLESFNDIHLDEEAFAETVKKKSKKKKSNSKLKGKVKNDKKK